MVLLFSYNGSDSDAAQRVNRVIVFKGVTDVVRRVDKLKLPKRYQGRPVETNFWENIYHFILYRFSGDHIVFFNDYERRLRKLEGMNSDEAHNKSKYLYDAFMPQPRQKKLITPTHIDFVSRAFGFDGKALFEQRNPKQSAYVLVSCTGINARAVFEKIKESPEKWPVVDEVSITSGGADLFIRVHGDSTSIQQFLLHEIYQIKNTTITSTRTLATFEGCSWQRYPINTHGDYKFDCPTWLDVGATTD